MVLAITPGEGQWMSEAIDAPDASTGKNLSATRLLARLPNGPRLNAILRRPGLLARLVLVVAAMLLILGATILVSIYALRTVEGQLQSLTSMTLPASSAAYEMEINLLGSGLGVLKHMLLVDPAYRARFEEDRKEFRKFEQHFLSAAKDTTAIAVMQRASKLFAEFEAVSERLIAARDAERAGLDRLGNIARDLDSLIDNRVQGNSPATREKMQLNNDIQELFVALLVYLQTDNPERRQNINQEVQELTQILNDVKTAASTKLFLDEARYVKAALAETPVLLAGHTIIRENLAEFIALRRRMDDLLDEQVQVFTARNLSEAHLKSTALIDANLRWMLIFSGIAGAVGVAAIWVVLVGVIWPVRKMLAAADAYAQGDLSHRIAPGAMGELGTLTAAMNQMAEELDAARARSTEINAHLEEVVAQRTRALEKTNRDLSAARDAAETASKAKSAFLGNMSHELRTPLNAIIGFAEVMRDELFGPLGSEQYKSYSQDIHASGIQLLALIGGILDYSQSDAGTLAINLESVDVVEVIHSCQQMIKAHARQRELGFNIVIEEGLPMLRADAARLRQVLLALAGNAIKFSHPGGSINLEAARTASGGVNISVSDSGIGMDIDEIVAALNFLVREDSRVARKGGGVGLGLPLAKALVERMGAKLEINSAPGKGTTVTVTFPAECVIE